MLALKLYNTSGFAATIIIAIQNTLTQVFAGFCHTRIQIIIILGILAM